MQSACCLNKFGQPQGRGTLICRCSMVITAIGQVGIDTPTKKYILTPTLSAIASLDDPVETYLDLADNNTSHEWRVQCAHNVILACSDDKSISQYLGLQVVGKPRLRRGVVVRRYNEHYIDDVHAVCIAESLLYHGMVGKVEYKAPVSSDAYSNEFNPLQWVSAVVAHLGLSERDAWGMTMTSILNAMKTKYPPSEKEVALAKYTPESKAAHDEWYASIYGPQSK